MDEIKLRRWLIVNAGVRYDGYAHFNRTTPRGALIVVPSDSQSFKYLYGRAFRAPNAYELSASGEIDTNLRPESIDTHEVVWEQYMGERLRTSVSAYRYAASGLLAEQVDATGTKYVNSRIPIQASGVELEGELRSKTGFQAVASYALQSARERGIDAMISNSPQHVAKVRASVPGPLPGSFGSFEWQYLSTRRTLGGATVAPAHVANLTFNVPLRQSLVMTGNVRNLLNQRYADPASIEHSFDSIEQNGRTVRIGLRWAFWKS
jgi:iron complex outermembrane receptor protein